MSSLIQEDAGSVGIHSAARLAVLDDSPAGLTLLTSLLAEHGFASVSTTSRVSDFLNLCHSSQPDIILVSFSSVERQGFQVGEVAANIRVGCPGSLLIGLTAREIPDPAWGVGKLDAFMPTTFHALVRQPLRQGELIASLEQACRRNAVTEGCNYWRQSAAKSRKKAALAFVDPVTQLPNRTSIQQLLKDHLDAGQEVGVLFIAIDGVDETAKLYGYHKSEALLRVLADRLRSHLGSAVDLGLWGGSEFIAVAEGHTREAVLALAETLVEALSHEVHLDNLSITVSCRIGAIVSEGEAKAERLMHQVALAVPPEGNASVQYYSEAVEYEQRSRLALQRDIKHAASRGELHIQYQPKVHLRTGEVVGAEALLRWEHRHLGPVSPDTFIALAEESGDIVELGEWVIQQVCGQVAKWEGAGLLGPEFSVAVNVAPRQVVQPDFASTFMTLVSNAGVQLSRISIEVTESGLMMQLDHAAKQLAILRKAGVGVAIDDFGMGNSSLSQLQSLPVSVLKIDKTFVFGLTGESPAQGRQFVDTIIQLSHGMGCSVVAEGVESLDQQQHLIDLGCEVGQGFLYSKALPAPEFMKWRDEYLEQVTPERAYG